MCNGFKKLKSIKFYFIIFKELEKLFRTPIKESFRKPVTSNNISNIVKQTQTNNIQIILVFSDPSFPSRGRIEKCA